MLIRLVSRREQGKEIQTHAAQRITSLCRDSRRHELNFQLSCFDLNTEVDTDPQSRRSSIVG
jgi:hypothetical protein